MTGRALGVLVVFASLLLLLVTGVNGVDCTLGQCTFNSGQNTWICTGTVNCDTLDSTNASILIENATLDRDGNDGASCGDTGGGGSGSFTSTFGFVNIINSTLDFSGGNGGGGDCFSGGLGGAGDLTIHGLDVRINSSFVDSHGGNGGSKTGACGQAGQKGGQGNLEIIAINTLTFEGDMSDLIIDGGRGGNGAGSCGSCSDVQNGGLGGNVDLDIVGDTINWAKVPHINASGGNTGSRRSGTGGTVNILIESNLSTGGAADVDTPWNMFTGKSNRACLQTFRDGGDSTVLWIGDIFQLSTGNVIINVSGGRGTGTGNSIGNSLFEARVVREFRLNESH